MPLFSFENRKGPKTKKKNISISHPISASEEVFKNERENYWIFDVIFIVPRDRKVVILPHLNLRVEEQLLIFTSITYEIKLF